MQDKMAIGKAFYAEGKNKEAIKKFLEILAVNPENKEVYNNLGVIAFENNDLDKAQSFFLKALDFDPHYKCAINNLDKLFVLEDNHAHSNIKDLNSHGLLNKKIAIVNPFTNKFNDIYASYFSKHNQVKVILPKIQSDLDNAADWADIVWCTWCNEPLVYLSQKKQSALLVSHIRSYEILTPSLMQSANWQNIDGAIFVAEHIRTNANEMWKNQLSGIPQTTICNSVELDKYPFYQNGIGFNIGYIGYINHKKGIGLLLQCIDSAVRLDKRFTLHLAGSFQETRFEVYMKHLIKEMGLDKNVIFHGWVKDVPDFLANMNYVISTSPWEGCPNNVIETMACGVKPLIHHWQGAKKLFPAELVFNNISELLCVLRNDCFESSDNHYDSAGYRRWVSRYYNASIQVAKIDSFIAKLWKNRL